MKKIYDKPLTNITTVRNQHTFCSSVVQTAPKSNVETRGHERTEKDVTNETWNDGNWDTTL